MPTQSLLRFANWSPDAPAADFCIAPHGTTAFQGPLLASRAAQFGAGVRRCGQRRPSVSRGHRLPARRARVSTTHASSPRGSTDCNAGITTDATGLPALPVGRARDDRTRRRHQSAARPDPGLAIVGFLDDLVEPTAHHLHSARHQRGARSSRGRPRDDRGGVFQRIQPNIAGVPFGKSSHQLTDPPDPNGTPDLTATCRRAPS